MFLTKQSISVPNKTCDSAVFLTKQCSIAEKCSVYNNNVWLQNSAVFHKVQCIITGASVTTQSCISNK